MLHILSDTKTSLFLRTTTRQRIHGTFEEDIDNGMIHGFTEASGVAAKYDPLLVNETKTVSLTGNLPELVQCWRLNRKLLR
jgi:threonylcarbamoyladenosine tRNA methylthiotransferase MtaB